MKKLIALLTIAGFLTFGVSNLVVAQTEQNEPAAVEQTVAPDSTEVVEAVQPVAEPETVSVQETAEQPATFREVIKKQFIDGGPGFMGLVLVILLIGMAVSIERIIYLTLASTNTKKLLQGIESNLQKGNITAAKDLCVNTRGPVASIFAQGLIRLGDGQSFDEIEKSIVSYGSVVTGQLEAGVSWISLFIGLAPMFGFMGTVIGMIQAFDDIAAAGDMSPTVVASGMKVALLTTVFGLIAGIILQVFYNFIVSKIEGIVNDMEDASISFMDILVKSKTNAK